VTATAYPTQPQPQRPIDGPTVLVQAPQAVAALANAVGRAQSILANADEAEATPAECARVAATLNELSYRARQVCSQQVQTLFLEAERLAGPLEVHNNNVAQRLADQAEARALKRSVRSRNARRLLIAFVVVVVLVAAVAVRLQWLG
jgi:t-SNARE complex subunit (syntaxin)